MAGLSDWVSIKSDGTIVATQQIVEFQYRHYINYDCSSSSMSDFSLGKGSWTMEVVSPDGEILLKQQVIVLIDVVFMTQLGVTFFTWYEDSAGETINTTEIMGQPCVSEKITTTSPAAIGATMVKIGDTTVVVPSGYQLSLTDPDNKVHVVTLTQDIGIGDRHMFIQPLAEYLPADSSYVYESNPAWKYTLGGTKYSEFGFLETGGGSDYGVGEAIITDWWDSPVYKINIPVGSKINVLHDEWSLGARKRVEWQTRWILGSSQSAACRFCSPKGLFYFTRMLDTAGTLELCCALGSMNNIQHGLTISKVSDPSIVVAPDGGVFLGVMKSSGFWEYTSLDGGLTGYMTSDDPLLPSNVTMPRLLSYADGRIALGVQGNQLVATTINSSGISKLTPIGAASSSRSYDMDIDSAGNMLIVNDLGEPLFTSSDGAETWQAYTND